MDVDVDQDIGRLARKIVREARRVTPIAALARAAGLPEGTVRGALRRGTVSPRAVTLAALQRGMAKIQRERAIEAEVRAQIARAQQIVHEQESGDA